MPSQLPLLPQPNQASQSTQPPSPALGRATSQANSPAAYQAANQAVQGSGSPGPNGRRREWFRRWGSLLVLMVLLVSLVALDQALRPASLPDARAAMTLVQATPPPATQAGTGGTGGMAGIDASTLKPVARGRTPMPAGARAAHASSLLVMPPAHAAALTLFWFSGERESGPMVQIAAAQWDRASQAWTQPKMVVNRHRMGEALGHGLRRLGNPVAWMDAQGRMHLFVVATGWGGWAASRILHLRQSSATQTLDDLAFEPVRVLPLSWLWNTSYMVRNAPMALDDGGMVLPVHFELGSKIAGALRFAPDGRFVGMRRLSRNDYWLQPALVAATPTQWFAYLRDERHDGRVGVVQTQDGGRTWSDLPDLSLPNPDASVAAIRLGPQQLLLAHNPMSSGRGRLDLSLSADGVQWRTLQTLEQAAPEAEFSYPAMAWADGHLWISYTVEREYLAWQKLAPAQPQKERP